MSSSAAEQPDDEAEPVVGLAAISGSSDSDGSESSYEPQEQPAEKVESDGKSASILDWERTPEGFTDLEWELRDIRRALNLDFYDYALGLSDPNRLELAGPRIEAINHERSQLDTKMGELGLKQSGIEEPGDEKPAHEVKPIDPEHIDEKVLLFLASTSWHELIPRDDSPESQQRWEKFKTGLPEYIQINLEWYREVEAKRQVLLEDKGLQDKVHDMRLDRMEVLQTATSFLSTERRMEEISGHIAVTFRGAGQSNRPLTRAEQRQIDRLRAQQQDLATHRNDILRSTTRLVEVKSEIKRLINIQNRKDFEDGIVVTEQMKKYIDELLPSLAQGQPALLVGETGGAKTALAEFISKRYFGAEPEFISGYGDVNSYQLMGKVGLGQSEGGATITEFIAGPVIRAMEKGVPLILDEINAMPAEFLKRLNKIMQLRPGDVFTVQEDSGREVVVRPGFVIIATANEKSKRYKGLEDLSVEFQNRFGANIVRVDYPDNNLPYGTQPTENLTIAVTALTDRAGNYSGEIKPEELVNFVKACHVTQQVFSGNHGEGFDNYVSTERRNDGKPGLEETVLAPRTMVDILNKVRFGHGTTTLDEVLKSFVSGIKNKDDREQIATILEGHGFLKALSSGAPPDPS